MFRYLLCASVFGFASFAHAADKPDAVIGTKAPSPNLPGLDGKPVKFDTLRGKAATVVVFISFECPVSNSYATQLNELAKDSAAKGVTVVLVCPADESPEAVTKAAAASFKPTMPVLIDSKKEFATALKAAATPEVFLLDAEGVVRYRGRIDDAWSARLKRNPVVSSHDLQDALAAVLAGKPVATAVTKPVGCEIAFQEVAPPKAGPVTF